MLQIINRAPIKKFSLRSFLPLIIALISFAYRTNPDVINYYGISSTLVFNNESYDLAWSSHPTESYYKHEYLQKGDSVNHFHKMILLDFVQIDVPAKVALDSQIKMLVERKKTDEVCNYSVLEHNGEYLLDFLMSESTGGHITTVEWNAYHYKAYTDNSGHKGVLLFGISQRSYNDDVSAFLKSLKEFRHFQLMALSRYPIPEIQVK